MGGAGAGWGAAGVAHRLAGGAAAKAHHKLVPAVAVLRCRQGQARQVRQLILVPLSDGLAALNPAVG